MDKKFNTLKIDMSHERVLVVTLNRPDVRNAINSEMMRELRDFWQEIFVHHEKIYCIVLTGSGSAFCAGADLKERVNLDLVTWRAQHAVFEQAMLAMLDCPVPIIAAVNGAAFGGGLELALASDFIYAADTATFAQPEVKVGIMPAALGTQNLPRACGAARAKELSFTGAAFSAHEAYEWGIVNKVCEHDLLVNEALATAEKICKNAPLAVCQVKKSINMSQQLDIKSGFAFEVEAYNRLLETKDREEGIRAFNEKRSPIFTGE